MIFIQRPAEPPALTAARARHLSDARLLGRDPTSDEITGYAVAKDALWEMQGRKCCYCEFKEQEKRNDVEHFRPKGRAVRGPGSAATHGYWWLAWTWENLLFSCQNCNQSPAKLDKFPLDVGSTALVAEEAPPGSEAPLLLDPTVDDGRQHILFKLDATKRQWIPMPKSGSLRGKATIEVCMLDRPDLLTLYTEHVEDNVQPEVNRICDAAATGDPAAVRAAVDTARRRLLGPRQGFVGLSCDALEHLVGAAIVQQFGLIFEPS